MREVTENDRAAGIAATDPRQTTRPTMFKKVLVANRGEIACRIMRTAKRMGLATVAVYSDADAQAPHVPMADEAIRLGPAPASESYLRSDLILRAARETGADCIHPGYGFLSERESFANACAEAGVTFVGPPPAAIAAMGDKIASKKLAKAAGVNVVPGFLGEIEDAEHAVRIATDIGYPVMMKASAGGGGKGMRLAHDEHGVREGFEATKREGLASFGDDRIFIEKFIESPRHIEIQVLGDRHGTLLTLGERECSIQRRHQKVIEEAPSPFVTPAMREAMGEQAIALARAVGYHSAGTVEWIVSGADATGRGFYFLEMNTRLQVEHPVTECVTGLDLVEQMIRVAAGERLPFTQADVVLKGWAIESRVYAEDPHRGFLPSIGRLKRYNPPVAGKGVRVDDGVVEGGEVSTFYDPMIAKLVTFAPTRDLAIDRQIAALDAFEVEGPATNLNFLCALMQHPRFRSGALTTGFIAEEYADGFTGAPASGTLLRLLAGLAAFAAHTDADRALRIDGQLGGRLMAPSTWSVSVRDAEHAVEIGDGEVVVDGKAIEAAFSYRAGDRSATIEGRDGSFNVFLARRPNGYRLTTRGATHLVRALPARFAAHTRHMIAKAPTDLSRFLISPMPGLLVRLEVAPGDRVEAGQVLAIVEAMKMENILRAQKAGTVKSVVARAGATLAVDDVILELE